MSVPNRFQTAVSPLALSLLDDNFDYLTTQLALYAPIAAPTFTGIPRAPTATAGTNTTQLATTAFVTAAVGAATAGVASFNGRTGVVTLTSLDVTNALGYVPNVTSVFGRTGAIVMNSGDVTTALGFTPYNSTNPSGFITSAALTPYALLAGAPFTGAISITAPNFTHLTLNPASGSNKTFINKSSTDLFLDVNRDTNTGICGDTSATHSRIRMSSGNGAGYIAFYSTNTNNTLAPEVFRVGGEGNVTVSGGVRINTNLARAITTTQSIDQSFFSGPDGGGYYNHITVDENITANSISPGSFQNALYISHTMAGTENNGGRNSLEVRFTKNCNTRSDNANRNYVGMAITAEAFATDGGGLGTERGALFGQNVFMTLGDGATHYINATGCEYNIVVAPTASVMYKSGVQIVAQSLDSTQGSVYDAALSISSVTGAVGWKSGILFSAANSKHPVHATGTLIQTQDAFTVANGIDFSTYTFSSNFLKSQGFTVAGNGRTVISNAFGATDGLDVFNTSNVVGSYGAQIAMASNSNASFVLSLVAAGQTQLLVTGDVNNPFWIIVGGVLKNVVQGALNSGGAGFRQLIVTN
jgi:hypothetical protein